MKTSLFTMIAAGLIALGAYATPPVADRTPPQIAPQKQCTRCNGRGTFTCDNCNGTGKNNGATCATCKGRGKYDCTTCNGTGKVN